MAEDTTPTTGDTSAAVAATSSASAADTSGAAPAAASVLAAGAASTAAAQPGTPTDPLAWLPAKHRVFGDDGKTLNLEASARKVAEAYGHAERRIGSGELPPKTAEEYKVNVPAALGDKFKAEDLGKDPMLRAFFKDAHAAGMTQKQIDMTIGAWLERAPALVQGVKQLDERAATAELRKTWATDAEFTEGVQRAFRAGKAFAGADFEGILGDYGNDPRIVRMLAAVGKELAEDASAPAGAQAGFQADLEALTKSKAYMDPSNPEHLATKQKVAALFARTYGNEPKRPGPIVITTG